MIVRKLGTLEQLLVEHGPTRDDVLTWAKNEVKIETEKYKKGKRSQNSVDPLSRRQAVRLWQAGLLPGRLPFSPIDLLSDADE